MDFQFPKLQFPILLAAISVFLLAESSVCMQLAGYLGKLHAGKPASVGSALTPAGGGGIRVAQQLTSTFLPGRYTGVTCQCWYGNEGVTNPWFLTVLITQGSL